MVIEIPTYKIVCTAAQTLYWRYEVKVVAADEEEAEEIAWGLAQGEDMQNERGNLYKAFDYSSEDATGGSGIGIDEIKISEDNQLVAGDPCPDCGYSLDQELNCYAGCKTDKEEKI